MAIGVPSIAVQKLGGMASTARLVPSSAIVCVGPPLFCSLTAMAFASIVTNYSEKPSDNLRLVSENREYDWREI
jgi:hypothetical protein